MATLTIPNTFSNGATIVAAQHNENFTAIKTFCEQLSAGTNIDSGAITSAALANSSVIEARIASNQISTRTLQSSLTLTTPNIGVATGTSLNTTGNVVSHIATTTSQASYTLVLSDDGKVVEIVNGSATTVTVPRDVSVAFPNGTRIQVIQIGAGQITLTPSGGVTINGTPGLKTRAQNSVVTLLKRGTDTWIAYGDLAA
jgi:hypothetical protein